MGQRKEVEEGIVADSALVSLVSSLSGPGLGFVESQGLLPGRAGFPARLRPG